MIVTHLTPVGGSVLLGDILRLGDNRRVAAIELDGPRMPRAFQGSLTPAEEKRRERSVPDCSNMVVARDTTMEPSSPS